MGKPLYRKLIRSNAPAQDGDYPVATLDEEINIKNIYGVMINGDIPSQGQRIPLNFNENNGYFLATYCSLNQIHINIGGFVGNLPCEIVIEYTKTTD